MYRCLIATLGRDAPGVNAAIRSVTRIASQRRNWKVYGARRGFPGILRKQIVELKESDVRFFLGRGGSLLGSSVQRIALDDKTTLERIGGVLQEFDLVVAIGGMGSFSILDQIYGSMSMGVTTTLFIPATIENEFCHFGDDGESIYAEAIGADTAANTGIAAVDRLREQSYLNRTLFLVQCVGVKSNFQPLTVGLACGAHRIYLPEYPRLAPHQVEEIRSLFGAEFLPSQLQPIELAAWARRLFQELRKTYAVVILPSNVEMLRFAGTAPAAEPDAYERQIRSLTALEFSLLRLVDELTVQLTDIEGVEIRSVILDDLQRGGPPSARDRLLGTLYGEAAVEEYLQIITAQDSERHANVSLLAVTDLFRGTWESIPRQRVAPLIRDPQTYPCGLDPVPFYRQSLGLLSGFRKLAALDDLS